MQNKNNCSPKNMGFIEKIKNKSWGSKLAIILPIFFVALLVMLIFLPPSEANAKEFVIPTWMRISAYFTTVPGVSGVISIAAYLAGWWNFSDILEIVGSTVGGLFEQLTALLFGIAKWFFQGAAAIFDFAIRMSLNNEILDSDVIDKGFNTVLNIANLFFIFILLYIAIATILQLSNFDWKKTISKLIIAALLINFSLFFTKIIIDVSNIFAVNFYNSMKYEIDDENIKYGPSALFANSFQFEEIFQPLEEKGPIMVNGEEKEMNSITRGMVYGGGAVFMIVAGFVFLAGAITFIKRTITFIFLAICAPIAFIGMILPYTQKFAIEWWNALIGNALVAPVFLLMLYLVSTILQTSAMTKDGGTQAVSFVAAMAGDTGSMAIILYFLVLIGLMWGALIISEKVCAGATTEGMKFAKKVTGTAAGGLLAGGAIAGRQTLGWAGRAISQSKSLQSKARDGSLLAKGTLLAGDKMGKSSWDARNIPVVGSTLTGALKKHEIDVGLDQKRGSAVGGFVGGNKALKEWIDKGRAERGKVYGGETIAGATAMADQYKKKSQDPTLSESERKRNEAIAKEIMKAATAKQQEAKKAEREEYQEAKTTAHEEIAAEERIGKAKKDTFSKKDALSNVIKTYQERAKAAAATQTPKERERREELMRELNQELQKEEGKIKDTERKDKKDKRDEAEDQRKAEEKVKEQKREAEQKAKEQRKTDVEQKLKDYVQKNSGYSVNTVSNLTTEDILSVNVEDLTHDNVAQHLTAYQIGLFAKRKDIGGKEFRKIKQALEEKIQRGYDPTDTDIKAKKSLRQLNKILGL